ncbi:MAG: hypothetical protein WBB25_09275 [Sulfitobacter sp.]
MIQIAPGGEMNLSSATIALSFNADAVTGSHGLLSKDASGYAGGGNHFTSYIKDRTLFVRFQGGVDRKEFTVSSIHANGWADGSPEVRFTDVFDGTLGHDYRQIKSSRYRSTNTIYITVF